MTFARRITLLCLVTFAALSGPVSAQTPDPAALLSSWPDQQREDGAFRDWLWNGTAGGVGGYGEAIMGYALTVQGARNRDSRMFDAGVRALRWALRAPSSLRIGRSSVFEDMAFAGALRQGASALPEDVLIALRQHLAVAPAQYLGRSGQFGNKHLVEAVRVLESRAAGVPVSPRQVALAEQLLTVTLPRVARAHQQRALGQPVSVFSDPPENPLAYHALTLAFAARGVQLLGSRAAASTRRAVVSMARGSWLLAAPDGDVAYWGRSQEQAWALTMTAYGAQVAAQLSPTDEPRMRTLTRAVLARLSRLHVTRTAPGLWLTPSNAQLTSGDDPRLGLDSYAGAVVYSALTVVAMQWAGERAEPEVHRRAEQAEPGAYVLSQGTSRFAVARRGNVWFSVKQKVSDFDDGDLRYDFGLVAAKVRAPSGWRNLIPSRPYDYRNGCAEHGQGPEPIALACAALAPHSAGPWLTAGGVTARATGTSMRVSVRGDVLIDGGFVTASGRMLRRTQFRFAATRAGVNVSWPARRADRYRLLTFFSDHAGSICRTARSVANDAGTVTFSAPVTGVDVQPGFASGENRHLTAAQVTVTAPATATMTVNFASSGCHRAH